MSDLNDTVVRMMLRPHLDEHGRLSREEAQKFATEYVEHLTGKPRKRR